MEIDIIDDKKNPLLSRREIVCMVQKPGVTPGKKDIVAQISTDLKVKPECVYIDGVYQKFGQHVCEVRLRVYDKPGQVPGYAKAKKDAAGAEPKKEEAVEQKEQEGRKEPEKEEKKTEEAKPAEHEPKPEVKEEPKTEEKKVEPKEEKAEEPVKEEKPEEKEKPKPEPPPETKEEEKTEKTKDTSKENAPQKKNN